MPSLKGRTKSEREIVASARKNRPVCRECGEPMEPMYLQKDVRVDDELGFTHRLAIVGVRGFGYAAQGAFCSLRCGYAFGMRAAQHEK